MLEVNAPGSLGPCKSQLNQFANYGWDKVRGHADHALGAACHEGEGEAVVTGQGDEVIPEAQTVSETLLDRPPASLRAPAGDTSRGGGQLWRLRFRSRNGKEWNTGRLVFRSRRIEVGEQAFLLGLL